MAINSILSNILTRQPLSPEQAARLDAWAREPENRQMLDNLLHAQQHPADAQHLVETVMRRVAVSRKRRRMVRWSAAAAAVAVVLVGGWWLVEPSLEQSAPHTALLLLDDGRQIELRGDTVVVAGGVRVEVVDGKIRYSASAQKLTLEVPRGVEPLSVELSDGSMVQLNSGSRLSYPAQFEGGTREVELSGEAFFEVARDIKHPFVVSSGAMTTTVLGTAFNICAYADEPAIKTTLLSGSVRVRTEAGAEQVLEPSMQASLNQGALSIRRVDTNAATAWRDGVMMLDETDLQQIARTLGRWYGVEVEWVGTPAKHTFTGRLYRAQGLDTALETLGMMGAPKIEVADDKILIHQ